jgi:hypothetical protein
MNDEPVRVGVSMPTREAATSGRILTPEARRAATSAGAASSRRAPATS